MLSSDITIYNHYSDLVTRADQWQRTVISGASWYSSKDVSLTTTGQISADSYKIRIPINHIAEGGRTYLSPKVWTALVDKSKHWTIQENDKLVKGSTDTEVVRLVSELSETHEEVATILGWSDNRKGVLATQHWLIRGK